MEQIKTYFDVTRLFTKLEIEQGYLEGYLDNEIGTFCHDFIITKPALTEEVKEYIESKGFTLRVEGYDLFRDEENYTIEGEDRYQYYYVEDTLLHIVI